MQSLQYDPISALDKCDLYITSLEFFEAGFALTDDDRLKFFDLRYTPWIKTLCKWFDDAEIEWINLIFISQSGKTTFYMGILLYASQYIPGAVPFYWILDTETEGKNFIGKRLKPFLDEGGRELLKGERWKNELFRIYRSTVKMGFGSTFSSIKEKPARIVIGDEWAEWKIPLSHAKKRTRTFVGNRKGIFGSVAPREETENYREVTQNADFYLWYWPCLGCGEKQPFVMEQLKYEGKRPDGTHHYKTVEETAKYLCRKCHEPFPEDKKLEIMNLGEAVCVDYQSEEPKEAENKRAKTLRINCFYSMFETFATIALKWIDANRIGGETLKSFYTDELAKVPPKTEGKAIEETELKRYIDHTRKQGEHLQNVVFYTAGIDVQRRGELYCVILGWRRGLSSSAHLVKCGVISWIDQNGKADWSHINDFLANFLGQMAVIAIDATDGVVFDEIYNFCLVMLRPFVPLREVNTQNIAVRYSNLKYDPTTGREIIFGMNIMNVNSHMIKDDISSALNRPPGDECAWSFPGDTPGVFFEHLRNEKRTEERRGLKTVSVWRKTNEKAPQHFFSAFTYAVAGHYENKLILRPRNEEKPAERPKKGILRHHIEAPANPVGQEKKTWIPKKGKWLR